MHKLNQLSLRLHPHVVHRIETLVALALCLMVFTSQASAVTRFQNRSLMIESAVPGVTTNYTVSFSFYTQASVGSIGMLFCEDPIPYMPCDIPAGLDASNAVLESQSGEVGFSIAEQSTNHILLTRTASVVGTEQSTYRFTGVVNPTSTTHSFGIRLTNYTSEDGSGSTIDVGSVVSQVTTSVYLETQVPPMLIFCLGQQVSVDCKNVTGGNYSDMGDLSPDETLVAQSQMALGTNATGGFVVTANGNSLSAGTRAIPAPALPTASILGTNQFGINLVANSLPGVGNDPDGPWLNATPTPAYGQPNKFMFKNGDVIASSPDVSLMRRFTVSYMVNINPSLPAGVYTTTITYIATGRF